MRGSVISHLAMTTFCWFPPESVETASERRADLDLKALRSPTSTASASLPASMNGPNDSGLERSDGQIVGDRHRQHQPFRLAVLGNERDADVGRLGMGRRARPHSAPIDRDRAGDPAQHAEQGEQQGLLALAVESAKADDLASADFEGDVVRGGSPSPAVRS